MNPDSAMERINLLTSHAWMVRNFLKNAPEFEDELELLGIPREIFDFIRAVETRYGPGRGEDYLKMVRKKIGKLRKAADFFAAEQPDVSDHTNFKQAVISLNTVVSEIETILNEVAT